MLGRINHGCLTSEDWPQVSNCKAIAMGRYVAAILYADIWPTTPDFVGITLQFVIDQAPTLDDSNDPTISAPGGVDSSMCTCPEGEAEHWTVQLSGFVDACFDMRGVLLGHQRRFFSHHQCLDCLKADGPPGRHDSGTCRIIHDYPSDDLEGHGNEGW
jgi:hypothetical protein